MTGRLVTVFGGSGFVGRHLVKRLAGQGDRVRVAVRDPEAAQYLKPMGDVGQIGIVQANVRHDGSVAAAVTGADAVVYLPGVLYKSGAQTFEAVHAEGPGRVALAAREAGAGRFIHVSAIGADPESPAQYGQSKAAGEAAVRAAFPQATILRPSLMFGPEDDFINRFAALARLSPVLPLIDGGETRFQPVYVGDVAQAMVAILDDPATASQLYELGGPQVLSFREILALILRETGRKRLLVSVPSWLMLIQAAFLQLLPKPPLTRDQVRLLGIDNVVSEGALGLADLGVTPTTLDSVLPYYIHRYRKTGQFGGTLHA
jgi:NADH dehydrogenase